MYTLYYNSTMRSSGGNKCPELKLSEDQGEMTMTMTMTMTIFYSTIDIQIEKIMYNSLENQIINWFGDYY